MGEKLKDWLAVDRPAITVSTTVNGTFVTDGVGANPLDDPVNCLVWLVNSCTSRGHSISAGDLVTTGNIANKGIPAAQGDTVVASFSGLGEITVSFI